MFDGGYKAKFFSVLGDSVSTLSGYSQPTGAEFYNAYRKYETDVYDLSDTWWGQVIEALGGRLLINDSISGSTVCSLSHNRSEACACGDRRISGLGTDECAPDIIMIFMGLNDRGYGVKLRPLDEGQRGDESIFSEAYRIMLEKIRACYLRAEIWCLTLPLADHDGYAPSVTAKLKTEAYSGVIAECAAACGCRRIDIHDMEPYSSCDGLHPNAKGMQMVAQAVLKALGTQV